MLEGKKISELDTVTNLQTGCCFPILSKGATKRITFGSLLSEIKGNLPETGIEEVKEDVQTLKTRADEASKNINTLTADVENIKTEVADVDEMVAGQNATIRNCVSTVESLEQVIENTHFDDVLELEEQVRANTSGIAQNAANITHKLDKTTNAENAGKAVVVDEEGNLVFGAAGVQVSEEEGNAIEEKEDGIYVAPLPEGLSGLPIGASILWASENIPAGFLKYDGTIYNKSDYPVLFTRIPDEWKIDENTFKLPDVKDRVAQGADGNLGELIEAGLPNITGTLTRNSNYGLVDQSSGVDGAFELGETIPNGIQGTSGTNYKIKFNASKSNPIYGNSDTVQQAAIALYYIIKATDYTTVQEDVIDDTKYTTGNVLSAAKVKEEIETVDNKNNYSTEETVIGTWIDGKPIYRRVITFSTSQLWGSDYIETHSNILNETEDIFIDARVIGYRQTDTRTIMCHVDVFRETKGDHKLNVYQNITMYVKQFIFEYTKTTD